MDKIKLSENQVIILKGNADKISELQRKINLLQSHQMGILSIVAEYNGIEIGERVAEIDKDNNLIIK